MEFLLPGCFGDVVFNVVPWKSPIRTGHVGIRVYLTPAQPLTTPWRGFWGGFRGRTVSSMVWGIEHGLVLR